MVSQPEHCIRVQYFNESDVAIYKEDPTPALCQQVGRLMIISV